MSAEGGPNVVTDGLVLCLDAANPKSYPGSGNNWTSLIASENFTKSGANSITFQNNYFRFPDVSDTDPDSSNRFVYGRTNLVPGSEGTFLSWARFVYTGNKANRYIVNSSDFSNRMYLQASVTSNIGFMTVVRGNPATSITAGSTPLNTWFFVGMTWINSNSMSAFFNGNFVSTSSFTNPTPFNDNIDIGQQGGTGRVFPGDIAAVYFYNRALSPQEILQNYNNTKSRFQL